MSIRLLPDNLVNIIAAGEVVERPANVVKELIENSLDAGATEISIDVKDGGRTLIMVSDNGNGMTEDDLIKSTMRHATSKLPTDDLLNINFMGFRGEALPSIASVSEMTIETNGMSLDASTKKISPSPREGGTSVKIKNLFRNVPARLKFLRSDRVEMMDVQSAVNRLVLARPNIGFDYNGGKFRVKATDGILDRFLKIAGEDANGKMLEISAADEDIEISGFVSDPSLRRASSIHQYLFVNGRPVKDKVLTGALRAAYYDVMHAREYPLCAIYLRLPNRMVDVNVSPAKTDVHFLEPSRIRDLIVRAIRAVIAVPAISAVRSEELGVRNYDVPHHTNLSSDMFAQTSNNPQLLTPNSSLLIHLPLGYARAQIGNKYILAEAELGLIIVDQHAAHERIVYERLKKGNVQRQPLLIPEVVKLEDADLLLDIKTMLEESGLIIEKFGENEIAIYEKPTAFNLDWAGCLKDIADEIRAGGAPQTLLDKIHHKFATFACHHSVRAGQKLSLEQMNALLRQIEDTERGGLCNHGRPVWKTFSFEELDGVFER